MPTIYIRDNCPYSAAVLHKLKEIDAKVIIKNVSENKYAMELLEKGGKYQLPCLIDGETVMYESSDIVNYLDRRFGVKEE